MSIADIANDLVALCREGKNLEAVDKYYANDIVSVESASGPDMPAEMTQRLKPYFAGES